MNQIERLGIGDEMILFDYFVADEEVARFFSVSDLVVQPYRSATQSGVTQVAYFSTSMVVTGVGGLREIVPDGEVGFVVDRNRRPSPGRSTVIPKTCPKNSGRTSATTKSDSPGTDGRKFSSFTGRSAKTRKKPRKPDKPDKNNKFAKMCFPEKDPGTSKNLKCISP
ncbi:MAG: hypothetical protein ACLUEV_10385 [Alistipes sp.]